MALPACMCSGVFEAGCDEAGRGCLAGPVYAAAVILPDDFSHPLLDDSKKLSEKLREELEPQIREAAIAWAVASVSAREIERINILQASILAMHRALDALAEGGHKPGAVIVDGNRFRPWSDVAWKTVVKGDGKFANIAAASVLAKTHRDWRMRELAELYPGYGWEVNKGYPTKAHREAILRLGPTEEHRKTFRLLSTPSLFD